MLMLIVAPVGRVAAAGDVGYLDGSYSGSAVTGREPQSKLWFNDGTWWASMYSSTSRAVDIHRLNWTSQSWSDTGVRIDERTTSSADTLWDGSKLYIVTAISDQTLSCTPTTSGDNTVRMLRFSYDAGTKTYSLDAGFPVTIATVRVQSVSIARDSTGRIWATWAYPTSSSTSSVFVTHSTTDTGTYGTPYVIPLAGSSNMKCADYSAIVAYNGRIGVMWSNQNDSTMHFGVHVDGDPDGSWTANNAASDPGWADNHVSVKSLVADPAGQVYAAMKTSLNNDQCPPSSGNAGKPLIVLAFMDATGSWQRRTMSTAADCETRPLVQIDAEHRAVYLFATYPPIGASYGSGGSIYYKSASLDNPNFDTAGPGTPFIQLSSAPKINNVSGSKQPLGSASGLVVLAADDSVHRYVHNALSLGSDTTRPTVTSVSPANGATDVAITAPVRATFSEPMLASTITASTLTLRDTTAGANVSGSVTYDAGTSSATLTPTAPLSNSHAFSATVKGGSGGVTDLAGNPMTSDFTWTFTSAAPDTTLPNVAVTAPANGATVSGPSVALSATASDNVAVDHVDFLVNGGVVATDSVAPYAATWDSTQGGNGAATVAATAVDTSGNEATSSVGVTVANSPPFSDGFESGNFGAWTTKRTGGDGTATIQTAVVKTGTYAAKLTESSNSNSLSYIRSTFTSNQADLTIGGDFQVASTGRDVPLIRLLDAGGTRRFSLFRVNSTGGISFTDGAGTVSTGATMALSAWTRLDARLVAGSGTATIQISVNGTQVYSSTSRTLVATRTLQLGNETKKQTMTLYADNLSVAGAAGTTPDTTITSGPSATVNATSASFSFTSSIAGSTFTCALDGGTATACTSPAAYSGLAAGAHTFSVAATANGITDPTPATRAWTIDLTAPVVGSTVPVDGATGVATTANVTATFSEPMAAASITSSTFGLTNTTTGSPVGATVAYNGTNRTATLSPGTSLPAGTTFTARITGGAGGVTDAAGNPLAADATWSFTTSTAADTTNPSVTLTAPADGTTVSGSSVALSATASDNAAVDHVDFLVGSTVVATDSSSPYSATWDSTSVSNGTVTISARAVDTSNNQATDAHTVTVSNGGSSALFSDGFESGGLSNWTLARTGGDGSVTVQGSVVKSGSFAARLSESATSGSYAYARETLTADQTELTVTGDFQIFAEGTSSQNVPIFRLFDSSGTRLVSLFRQSASGNKIYVGYGGSNKLTTGLLPLNTWGTFELHVIAGAGTGTVEVRLNGTLVYSATGATLASIRTIQIGNDTTGQPLGVYADNIVVQGP
jgi:Big-like domain-containing protein